MDVKELQLKVNRLQALLTTKKKILEQLADCENQINIILSQVQIKTVSRKRISTNGINHYILKVMCPGVHMAIKEITAKILEAGYQTDNKKFSSYVQIAITKRDDIKKIRRGVYSRNAKLIQTNGNKEEENEENEREKT